MTMLRSLAGLAGVAALFAGAQVARADDVIPLKSSGTGAASTITLGYNGSADTELARYGRGGYGGGGYGGYRGGFHGGYRGGYAGHYGGYRGFYAGYRGFYGGYHRPYYAGFYRPYYGGYYGSPYYYNSYYSTPYYGGYGGGYYSAPYYDYGCSATPGTYGAVTQLSVVQQPYYPSVQPYGVQYGVQPYNGTPYGVPQQGISGYGGAAPQQPMPPLPSGDGTFPYDGGPTIPVPMPRQDAAPAKSAPPATTTLRLVNTGGQPAPPTQFSFPAYGEDNRASGFAIDRTAPVRKTSR